MFHSVLPTDVGVSPHVHGVPRRNTVDKPGLHGVSEAVLVIVSRPVGAQVVSWHDVNSLIRKQVGNQCVTGTDAVPCVIQLHHYYFPPVFRCAEYPRIGGSQFGMDSNRITPCRSQQCNHCILFDTRVLPPCHAHKMFQGNCKNYTA